MGLFYSQDGDQGDIFSCSEDDGASDMSELPYDALSMGTTQIGSPLSGVHEPSTTVHLNERVAFLSTYDAFAANLGPIQDSCESFPDVLKGGLDAHR